MKIEIKMKSTQSKTLGLGIIGSGGIANTHADALNGLENVRLVAVTSRNPSATAELAAKHGAEVESSVGNLINRSDLDAVLVATPSGAHLEPSLWALEAGKHVLCEKPLEINSERAQLIIHRAEQKGLLLGGFFPMRFGAGARAIKRMLDSGRFGRLVSLGARVKWWREASYYKDSSWRGTWSLDGGGALMNQGIHAVDLLQWFGGGRPAHVSAYAGKLAHLGIEVEDTLSAILEWPHGAIGTITASTACYPGLEIAIEISGDEGSAVLVNGRINFWKFCREEPWDEEVKSEGEGGVQGGSSDPRAISCAGHREQIRIFCESIRSGSPLPDFLEGREAASAVAIVEAIYKSVRSLKSEPVT